MLSDRDRKKLNNRLQSLYDRVYKIEDHGHPIATTFHTLPLRTGTDYYKIVKNPLSLHGVGRKIKNSKYDDGQQFVDDLSQVSWNARLYNIRESKVYRHALILKQFVLTVVIPKLKNDKAVPNSKTIAYPVLGDLPDEKDEAKVDDIDVVEAIEQPKLESVSIVQYETTPQAEPAYSGSGGRPTPPLDYQQQQQYQQQYQQSFSSTGSIGLLSSHQLSPPPFKQSKHVESGIRRGRPPIIDKPFETRIKLILKSFKKLRDPNNESRSLTQHFDKLPDTKTNPLYYHTITNPISLFEIKVKVRTRKYTSVDQFIHDLDVMFLNFQMFYQNDPYSEEFIDFQNFNREAHAIIQQEISKSDQDLMVSLTSGNDGVVRYPLDTLEVNGYSYKIGDWVLIENGNDPEKPTVGQIFRLWSTEDGNRYCNVCWYYRPEQTCHVADRLFFLNEVCKTGQYRDHLVNEIVGPCYVIFLTRYQKGDLPDGVIPDGAPWFICEFRYNESNHVFNRIRTWKACLPDEVRDHPEQPLIPLNDTRKLIKYESPIKSLLPKDAYIGMPIPEPTLGQPKAPPLVGLVYLAPAFKEDDLGQYVTSPNVAPMPELDETASGRRAFLFTPISQLKGGGGATTTVYTTGGIALPSVETAQPPVVVPVATAAYSAPIPVVVPEEKPILPGTYKLLQSQIQESQSKRLQEQQLQQLQQQQQQQVYGRVSTPPTSITPTGSNFHTSTSNYSTLLAGGVLSYALDDVEGKLADFTVLNKRRRINHNSNNDTHTEVELVIFYRAPPYVIPGNRIITNNATELGHSAAYLAWKLNQS